MTRIFLFVRILDWNTKSYIMILLNIHTKWIILLWVLQQELSKCFFDWFHNQCSKTSYQELCQRPATPLLMALNFLWVSVLQVSSDYTVVVATGWLSRFYWVCKFWQSPPGTFEGVDHHNEQVELRSLYSYFTRIWYC